MKARWPIGLAIALWTNSVFGADRMVLFQNLSPISGMTIIAHAKELFKQHGLEVEVRNVTSGKLALDALIGGSANLATVAETPVMRAGLAGQAIRIVATMEASDNDVQFLARADRGIKSGVDLKGKKIATAVGTSAEYMVVAALTSYGLKTSDVSIINLRPQDMATALDRGDIEAYAIWEPHIYNGRKLMGNQAVSLTARGIYVETFNIVGMRDYLQKNQDIVHRFIQTLFDAEAFINANPAETIKIIADAVQMDVPTMSAIRDNFNFKLELDADILKLMKKQADWDAESGKPASVSDIDRTLRDLIVLDHLKRIAPERIRGF